MTLRAFAPGRVNLIGEHTDYNDGLALPFAIEQGVTVRAQPLDDGELEVVARDLGERDRFALADPQPAPGWRAFARGVVAELAAEGVRLHGARLEISSTLPQGAGLSSSAALTVALVLALLGARDADRLRLARLCSRVENEWVGARTGLLDQTASLCGRADHALRIDFRDLAVEPVPLRLGDWRLVTVDSGERRAHARGPQPVLRAAADPGEHGPGSIGRGHEHAAAEDGSGYNARRRECAAACERLGVASLREADPAAVERLPPPLDRRARHVLEENARVEETVAALRQDDLERLARLLDASHASLRDLYESSTPAVERTVAVLREAGAAGARMVGGGFGGHVLALLPPGVPPPSGALALRPSAGARLVG